MDRKCNRIISLIFLSFDFKTHLHFRESRKDLYPSPGLLSQGEQWHKNRSAVQQDMMRAKSAMYYIDDMEVICKELIDVFEETKDENQELDIYPLLKLWSIESISNIFLHTRLYSFSTDKNKRTDDAKKMIEAAKSLNEANMKLFFIPKIWKYFSSLVPTYRQFSAGAEMIQKITKSRVDAALEKLNLEDESEQSILAKLARRNGKDSQLIRTMAQDALLAGIDTTGTSATFLIYHLACNPDKQEILYKEIADVIGDIDEKITESKLNKMRYLKATLHESQRMTPSLFGSSRLAASDYVLSGYLIPKGTMVVNMNQVTSNNSDNFRDPEQFLPERWLRSNPESKCTHAFSSIPFGFGPRMCVGRRFAEVQIYCLIIKTLQNYKIEYRGEPVGVMTELLNAPDRDVFIKFINRK